jgi:hypothetical protein
MRSKIPVAAKRIVVPEFVFDRKFVIDFDPQRPDCFQIRYAASKRGGLDMRPVRVTSDNVGSGRSIREAFKVASLTTPKERKSLFRAIAKRWPPLPGEVLSR